MIKFNIESSRPSSNQIFNTSQYEKALIEYDNSDSLKPIHLNFDSDVVIGYIESIKLTDDKTKYIVNGSLHSPYAEMFKSAIQNKSFTVGTKIVYDPNNPSKCCHIQKHTLIFNNF